MGQRPQGSDTRMALSHMFTETLGEWSLWMFAVGAFCILYSSTVAAVAGGGRYIPDYLIDVGFISRDRLDLRRSIIKGYALIIPFVGFSMYEGFQNPVLMVTIAACFATVMLPVQCGITIYLHAKRLLP
jgi:Mn2+/Fe2+ NRAMP family transporter